MSNYLERIGQDKIEDREEIEQLTARVRELEEELERKMSAGQYVLEQLAASQAYAEQLREALETLNKVSNIGCDRVEKALALPRDTSAFDAYVAKRLHDMACDKGLLRIQVEELTRQRDLAVEALEWAADVLPPSDPGGIGGCDCPVCRALEAIKGSEAMAQGEK